MSEESVQSAEGNVVPGEVTASSRQEEIASQHGWVPQEEWIEQGKDPDQWHDASTFNMRGEFFDKIHRQKREVDQLRQTLNDLREHQTQIIKAEREKVRQELLNAKKEAINISDGDAVIDLDQRIAELDNTPLPQPQNEEIQRLQQEAQERMDQWTSENKWYTEDTELQEYADYIGTKLAAEGTDPDKIWTEVPKRVKKQFPHKFSNPRRQENAVAETTNTGGARKTSKGPSWNDLDDTQKAVAIRFEKSGTMSREDYIKDLADSGLL